jgi:hypothetical protein
MSCRIIFPKGILQGANMSADKMQAFGSKSNTGVYDLLHMFGLPFYVQLDISPGYSF